MKHKDLRHRVERTPLLENEPRSLADLFHFVKTEKNRPDLLNFKKNGEWQSISSTDLYERAERIATGLYSLGIEKGDRVAILAPNSPNWTIADAACQIAGIIDVPIYTTLTPDTVSYVLRNSGAKLIFLEDEESYERLKEAFEECDSLSHVVLFDSSDSEIDSVYSLEQLSTLDNAKPDFAKIREEVDPDDIATLIYTSGTTGDPKGVMLTHENLISNVVDSGENFSFTENEIPLSVLPLSHVFERTGMYLYLVNGMKIHYAESIEKVAENLQEVRPTIFVGVPRIFEKVYAQAKLKAALSSPYKERLFDWAINVAKEKALLDETGEAIPATLSVKYKIADKLVYSKLRDFFGGRLRFCITGGAALSDSIFLIFTGAGIPIMQGYGLTETSPVITSNNPVNVKLGTVGKTIRHVQVRIADDGEIEVAGPNVMRGYYNNPEATRDTFSEDGWFKTGDIGEIGEDGYLRITDRKKELFKTSGGKYIAPSPIEQMIKGSRFVAQVVLVGNSRKFASALIVPDFEQLRNLAESKGWPIHSKDEMVQTEEVVKHFEKEVDENCEGLARFETVKKIALLKEELTVEGGELTPTLKIKRRIIDEKYQEVIDGIYEGLD